MTTPIPSSSVSSLDRQIEQTRQQRLAGDSPDPVLSADVEGGRVRCRVGRIDEIGCEVERIEVESPPTADVAERARAIAGRVTYLLEPLELIETDQEASSALVRSAPPWRNGETREYYELNVTPQAVNLQRFRKEPGKDRDPVPMQVTRQAVTRLAKDLVG